MSAQPEPSRDRAAARPGLHSCVGKEAYITQARAMDVIRRRQRHARRGPKKTSDTDRRELMRLSAYHCQYCHHWHIGSDHGLKGPR